MEVYFAYGSNLNLQDMSWRCPQAKPIVSAVVKNAELVFKGCADVEFVTGKEVVGALYEVTPECIVALDGYEGFPSFYTKKYIVALGSDGVEYECFIYVMTPVHNVYTLPYIGYFDTVREGYNDWKLDLNKLKESLYDTAKKVIKDDYYTPYKPRVYRNKRKSINV